MLLSISAGWSYKGTEDNLMYQVVYFPALLGGSAPLTAAPRRTRALWAALAKPATWPRTPEFAPLSASASRAFYKIKAPDYSGVSFVHTNENRPIWISKQFSVNCQPTIKQLSGCTQNSNLIFFSFQCLFSNNAGAGGASLVISVAAV